MNTIQVTVIYAQAEIQYIYKVSIISGSTVQEAILQSKILNILKNISLYSLKVGIYNKLVDLKYKIKDGDRIEIYRELIIDPRERRRNHALFFNNRKNYCF